MIYYLIEERKLQKDRTIPVWKSSSDILSAHDNGIIAAAVLKGYGDVKDIVKSKLEYFVDRIKILHKLLVDLRGDQR